LPGMHRYLDGLLKSRPGRIVIAGAALCPLLLGVSACGAAATASPSAASSSSPGGASAYLNCLREHGVTGSGRGTSGASAPAGSTPSSSTISNARQACASLRPSGGFGGAGGFSAALSRFESCLSAHGVTLPSPSASGGGFRGLFSQLQSTSVGQAALNACKSDLPFTPGGGTGGSGGGSGSGYGGTGGSGGGTSGGTSGSSGAGSTAT
jgi:hypothetical protein